MAEWDPYTRPIMTEIDGFVGFEDLSEGISMSESIDEATGIAKRVVTDWRLNQRSASMKPAIVIKGKDGKVLKLPRGTEARYMLPVESILSFDVGGEVKAGDIVARISMEGAKTRGHHRRSAACGGIVRGPASEGSCHHRRDGRHDPVRQGL